MSKISPKTLRIVYCATFIAIAVVVGSFLSFYVTESIKFNLAPVIIMLTGAVLGPIYGAAAGGVTDVLSFLIGTAAKPGPYFPAFPLRWFSTALLPGCFSTGKTGNLKFPPSRKYPSEPCSSRRSVHCSSILSGPISCMAPVMPWCLRRVFHLPISCAPYMSF